MKKFTKGMLIGTDRGEKSEKGASGGRRGL